MLLSAGKYAKHHTCCTFSHRPFHGCFRPAVAAAVNRHQYCFVAPEESGTQHLAALLAKELRAGDCYCLLGDVGAGKSFFSREFIRAAAQEPDLAVPSPTYLLQQVYEDHPGPPIHHFDLYRLDSSSGISRLDLPYSFSHAVSLIEWAGKLHQLPSELLEVHITLLDEQSKAKLRSNSTVLEDAADSSSSEEELAFEDRHWRKICLQPTGSSWVERVTAVTEDVVKHGEQHGLLVTES